jgi:hypothetical protein
MTRIIAMPVFSCLVSACLLGIPADATANQQPVEKTASETVKKAPQKTRKKTSRPTSARVTSPKSTTAVATAKSDEKPGKRFWSRIMDAFRDVHSVEKKTN